MPRYTGVDFYDADSLLTEEERAIRDQVRDWVEDRFLPKVEQAYEEAYFPADVIPEIAEMGLLGATLPETYGCAGIGDFQDEVAQMRPLGVAALDVAV